MKRLYLALILAPAFWQGAQAQIVEQIGAGHALGNPTSSQEVPVDTSLSALFDQAFCATNGQFAGRAAGVWTCVAGGGGASLTVNSTAISGGAAGQILADNGGTLVEYTTTGTGTVVALKTSPLFITPILGAATATSINGLIITTTLGTLTIPNNASASLITSGNFALTLTATATTNATFPSGTQTLAALGVQQTWTAQQSFNSNELVHNGATSGSLIVNCAAVCGNNTLTLPAGTTNFSLTGGASQVVKQTSLGGAFSVAQLTSADITGVPPAPTVAGTMLQSTGANTMVWTATPALGVAGTTVGTIGFANATSGTITLSPVTGALGAVTLIMPAISDTLVTLTATQSLTNKTLTSATNSLGGVTAAFGSDAKGDIYTNGGSSNVITRLGVGATNALLTVASALPAWTATGTGVIAALGTNANASGGIITATPTRAGDIIYWNGSAWTTLAGNNSGTTFLQETNVGVPSWAAAGGSGTVTSVATADFVTGGTITTTGTIHAAFLGGSMGRIQGAL
jgi:hypothetical protein